MRIFLLTGSVILAVIVLILSSDDLDAIWFGHLPALFVIFLLPFVNGILLILTQAESRCYAFVPKLLFGSIVVSIVMSVIIQLRYFIQQGYTDRILSTFMYHNVLDLFIPFVILSIVGGLIGLVIRGTTLIITKHKMYEKT